jgi:hypothetical protein
LSGWNEQFQVPEFDALLAALSTEEQKAISSVRNWAKEQLGVRGQLEYYQASWGWAEQYVLAEPHEGALSGVYLVPAPEQTRVALCCDRFFFEQHRLSDFPKSVQPSIREGTCIGRRVWVECPLSGAADAEGVCTLLSELRSS